MANVIRIKRKSTTGAPTAGQLEQGELAINLLDETLYSKNSTNAIFELTDHDNLTNYVANEHIDWTSATENFNTSGTFTASGVSRFNITGISDFIIDRQSTTGSSLITFQNDDGTKGYSGFNDAEEFLIYDNALSPIFKVASTGNITTYGTATFSANPIITNSFPQLYLRDTDATVDEKNWILSFANDTFELQTAADATPTTEAEPVFTVARTGTAVDSTTFNNGTLIANDSFTVAAGTVTLPNIHLGDNSTLFFGDADDVSFLFGVTAMYTDLDAGYDWIIRSTNGTETALVINDNTGAPKVDLYYNNVLKAATSSAGFDVTGTMAATTVTGANVTSGSDPGHTHTAYLTSVAFDDLTAKTSGTGNYTTTGIFTAQYFEGSGLGPLTTPGNEDVYVGGYGLMGDRTTNPVYISNVNGPVALNHESVHGGAGTHLITSDTGVDVTGTMAATTVTGANVTSGVDPGHTHTAYLTGAPIDLADNEKIRFGTSQDVEMYFSSVDFYIDMNPTQDFRLRGGASGTDQMITALADSSVYLYYNSLTRVQTTSSGGTLSGLWTIGSGMILNTDGYIDFGNAGYMLHEEFVNDELQINVTSGYNLRIGKGGQTVSETMALFLTDGAVSLYYNNVLEFRTQSHSAGGQTSGAEVYDHAGILRDVGFNTLDTKTTNASDVLEAQHSGGAILKTGSTGYTITLPSATTTDGQDFPIDGVTTVVNAFTSGNYTINASVYSRTLYWLDGSTRTGGASTNRTVGPGGVVTIWRQSSTVYYIWGSGIS